MSHKLLRVHSFVFRLFLLVGLTVSIGSRQEVEAASSSVNNLQGIEPASVTISGPDRGSINETYSFTATVTPDTATTPITYVWTVEMGNGASEILNHEGGLTDQLSYTWTAGGFGSVSVRATNADGYATAHLIFAVEVPAFLYPPYPLSAGVVSVFDHCTPQYQNDQCLDLLTWRGERRTDLSYNGHAGIDYDVNYLPIFASDTGQIVEAGWDDPQNHTQRLGLYVKLQHSNDYYTLYGHLSSLAVKACVESPCPDIGRSEVIGISGDTGNSDGPHLHFEVRTQNDKAVDPYGYNPMSGSLDPEPRWKHTQPNSLWKLFPDVSIAPSILPVGSGNALRLPAGPRWINVIDDYAHLLDEDGHLPPDSSPYFETVGDCWDKSGLKAPDEAENRYNLYTNAIIGDADDAGTCFARWYLPEDQPSGNYAVYLHIPRVTSNPLADSTVYRVFSAGVETAKLIVSQYEINSRILGSEMGSEDPVVESGWIYIGAYQFEQGGGNYIELSNTTIGNTYDNDGHELHDMLIAADAAQFAPVAGVADVVTIIDSSGSMGWNDPQDKRLTAARSYVWTASQPGDYVAVVDFDSYARVASPLQRIPEYKNVLLAAIDSIDSSGNTNIGLGVQTGCDVLMASQHPDLAKGAILLTDGVSTTPYADQHQCFVERDWKIYTFGFGDADELLLQDIALDTGGEYKHIDNVTQLPCEFARVRALIAGVVPSPCIPVDVPYLGTVSLPAMIPPGQAQATFTSSWPGSDVVMTLTTPSGRVIDRNTVASDVVHYLESGFESYSVSYPEPGEWQVSLYGADVPPEGEQVIFGFTTVPAPTGGEIFSDGFESGDFSAWSEVVTDEGDLSVTAQAALAGSYGMQAQIDDITAIFVRDNSPDLETAYQASFTFDPNSVAMASGESFSFFLAYSPQGEIALSVVKLILSFDGENYYLRAGVLDDEGWYAYLTPPTTVSDEPHTVAVEWQAATAEGANDGRFAFAIDGASIADYSDIDNDTNRIDFALLGTIGGIDAGTSGIAYFDDFSSSRVIQGGALAALSRGESLDFPVEDEFKTVDILPYGEK